MILKRIALFGGLVSGLLTVALNSAVPIYAAGCTLTVTNTNDSGSGSLRQAILTANNSTNVDVICFSISTGRQQIVPSSALPPITQPLTIDGTTQPNFDVSTNAPIIELSGNGAGSGAFGLRITGNGGGSTIRGLIINHFASNGIFLDSSNNTVIGNYIGLTADGTTAASNMGDGIGIFSGTSAASANGNIIGGTTSADRNVISGNGLDNPNGANGVGITAQNGGSAINNIVRGNYIGTNAAGIGGIANRGDGILVNNPDNGGTGANAGGNIIGGTTGTTPGGACTGACNLVSGNTANGIGLWHAGVANSNVQGNYVGTNAAGTSGIGNGNIGIEVNLTPNNTIGGTTPAARNVFSANGGAGVFLTGDTAASNVVSGNYIGTAASGNAPLGNVKMGVGIGASPGAVGARNDIIGGTIGVTPGGPCTGSCNLISANGQNGIFIAGEESSGHRIIGNYIGTNVNGDTALGNASDGIGMLYTPNITIGGNNPLERNIIAANGSNGIIVAGESATGTRIVGNAIGISSLPTPLGNHASGVAISGATDVAILANQIAYNGLLGIDLDNNGSVNINTPGGPHTGANHLQNYPNVYSARTVNGVSKIGGQFNGTPSTNFQIDFYYSDGCNGAVPRNYGQGQNYIGSIAISTDVYGNTAFGYSPSSVLPGNKYITATATKKIGNVPAETSEFSKCVLVNAAKPALTNGANWFLKDYLTTGPGDQAFGYGFPAYLLMCAWDPNQPGVKLPVIYSGGSWFMRASYTTGTADKSFSYGSSDYTPVCGDWNGDGIDTPGLVSGNEDWLLRNDNSGGGPDAGHFQFGPAGAQPVVGDWDGNGSDSIGVVTRSNQWYLRNSNTNGGPDAGTPNYGFSGGRPVVGDWDGNGSDSIGTFDGSTWALRNSNTNGAPDVSFNFGLAGATPVVW